MELIKVNEGEITLVDSAVTVFKDLIRARIEYQKMEEQLKEELRKAMEEHGIKTFDHPILKATYIGASQRRSIDTKRLKEEYPFIAVEMERVSEVKAQVRISIK